jgi:hypothetical protein
MTEYHEVQQRKHNISGHSVDLGPDMAILGAMPFA